MGILYVTQTELYLYTFHRVRDKVTTSSSPFEASLNHLLYSHIACDIMHSELVKTVDILMIMHMGWEIREESIGLNNFSRVYLDAHLWGTHPSGWGLRTARRPVPWSSHRACLRSDPSVLSGTKYVIDQVIRRSRIEEVATENRKVAELVRREK